MTINAKQIKLLREQTGAGMLDCKTALVQTEGNFEKAIDFLRQKGLATAEKKSSRVTKQGLITSYIHTGGKLGVLLEINCETDFVARHPEFKSLATTLAMQIAANASVRYISLKDIPQEIWEKEKQIESEREDIKGKPDEIRNSIIKGRIEKTLKSITLLDQPSIRDSELIVQDFIKSYVALLKENIQVQRFCKFVVGDIDTNIEEKNETEIL